MGSKPHARQRRDAGRTAKAGRCLILTLLLLFSIPVCFAQTGSVEQTTEGSPRQKLSWPEDEYALEYEVIVEQRSGEKWTGVFRTVTQAGFVELALPPAGYRYRVQVYNLLGQVEQVMGPEEFQVLPALRPEIIRFSPESRETRRGAKGGGSLEIVIEGNNILSESKVYLYQEKRGERKVFPPRSYSADPSGKRAVLTYGEHELEEGGYRIYIENPGGLSHSAGQFTVYSVTNGFTCTWSGVLGFSPFIPLNGFLNEVYSDPLYPLGFQGRAAFIFLKNSWGDIGLEGILGLNALAAQKSGAEFNSLIPYIIANVLYQKALSRYFDFRARAGFGMNLFVLIVSRDGGNITKDPLYSLIPVVDAGVSLIWKINPSFYGLHAEFGLDFVQFLSQDAPLPAYLRPFAGIGLSW